MQVPEKTATTKAGKPWVVGGSAAHVLVYDYNVCGGPIDLRHVGREVAGPAHR